MTRAWRGMVLLLDRREPATTLALFRIAVGLVVLHALQLVVGADLVEVFWVDASHGGYRELGEGGWLVRWLGGPTPRVAWTLVWGTALGATLLIAGAFARLAAFLTLHGYAQLCAINPETGASYDAMICNALWLLVLADSGRTLSLGCWLRERRWRSATQVPAWPRYLVIFQLVVVYTATGLQKVSITWNPLGGYSALYWVLQDPTWTLHELPWMASLYPLTQLATAVTWHFEVGAPRLAGPAPWRRTAEA